VPNAIRVFEELRARGHRPLGIRLDSGDLAYLAIQAARLLDHAGFPEASIVLSNEIDELVLLQIITQIQEEAARYGVEPSSLIERLVYGVGTHMITSAGDAALDGVYKLVAVFDGRDWRPVLKLSHSPEKVPNPGQKGVWRLYDRRGKAVADVLGLAGENLAEQDPLHLYHPVNLDVHRSYAASEISEIEPLLVEVLHEGQPVGPQATLAAMRRARERDVERLDPGVCRIMNPHTYHVSLTARLRGLKQELIRAVQP
jgi:nicotinate phosphoribosyltransferase